MENRFLCHQMTAFQISSGAFWCLVCNCASPGCCGGWAVNSQRVCNLLFSTQDVLSLLAAGMLHYSVMIPFISSHTEMYLSMILSTLVSFDSWVWCTLTLESVPDMEVQHFPENNRLCSPQIWSLIAVETLHIGAVRGFPFLPPFETIIVTPAIWQLHSTLQRVFEQQDRQIISFLCIKKSRHIKARWLV